MTRGLDQKAAMEAVSKGQILDRFFEGRINKNRLWVQSGLRNKVKYWEHL